MKRLIFFILVFLLAGVIFAEKVVTFPQLNRPFFMKTDDNHLYITDGPTINIYSLKDYSLVKRFGERGDGPQEFKLHPRRSAGSVHIFIHPDYILANSQGKVSYFTKEGKFIKELPTKNTRGKRFRPLRNQFVGEGFTNVKNIFYNVRNIYDSNFKQGKELYKRRTFQHAEKDWNPYYMVSLIMHVYENKVYINDGDDLKLHVFDSGGDKLPAISCEYDRLLVTGDHKKKMMNWYRTSLYFKQFYPEWKNLIKFPKYAPAIRWFDVVDQKVYVLTHKKEGEKSEFVIFDIKGKLLKKVMVFLGEKDERIFYPYTIKNEKIYQLIENEDEEEWELHVTKIN